MVQIIKENRKPTFSEKLNKGFGIGIEAVSGYMAENEQKQRMMQQKKELSQLTGLNLMGIEDPKILEKAFEIYQQGHNQQKLESLKQSGKQGQINQKQQFLQSILGNQGQGHRADQNQTQMPQEGMGMGQQGTQQQGMGFDPLNITDAQILQANAVDPNLGREMRAARDTALRERRADKEFEVQEMKNSPDYQRQQQLTKAQAAEDTKYNKELQAASKQHELKKQTLDRLESLNKKGVTGKPFEKALERIGLVALTSEGRREFAADIKNLITDIRSILGSQFSQFEFQTILNAFPSPDFSQKANESIIRNLKDFEDIRSKEIEFGNQLKKENRGKIPEDFQSRVNEKVQEYAISKLDDIKANTRQIMNEEYGIQPGHVLMFDQNGEPLSVPHDRVQETSQRGALLP